MPETGASRHQLVSKRRCWSTQGASRKSENTAGCESIRFVAFLLVIDENIQTALQLLCNQPLKQMLLL